MIGCVLCHSCICYTALFATAAVAKHPEKLKYLIKQQHEVDGKRDEKCSHFKIVEVPCEDTLKATDWCHGSNAVGRKDAEEMESRELGYARFRLCNQP